MPANRCVAQAFPATQALLLRCTNGTNSHRRELWNWGKPRATGGDLATRGHSPGGCDDPLARFDGGQAGGRWRGLYDRLDDFRPRRARDHRGGLDSRDLGRSDFPPLPELPYSRRLTGQQMTRPQRSCIFGQISWCPDHPMKRSRSARLLERPRYPARVGMPTSEIRRGAARSPMAT